MPTLEEMASAGGLDSVASTRDDYNAYAEACMMAGKPALSMADWIKAGKPAGPK